MGRLGFSYVGLIFLLMLTVPNLIWTKHKPQGYDYHDENKVLLVFERVGQICVTCTVLVFSDFNIHGWSAWSLWLIAAVIIMIMYECWWIRYFKSEKTLKDFYSSFYGVPVAGATLPIIAFFFLGIYGKVIWLMVSVVILGIGHIGIHLQHLGEGEAEIYHVNKRSVDMDNNSKVLNLKTNYSVAQLVIAVCGVFIAVFGLSMFNQHLLMSFSLPLRMVLMIVTQWLLFLVPAILMIVNKEKLSSIGIIKEKILSQIGIGVLLALTMSLVLTVLPIILGFKDMVGNTTYTRAYQFVYQFIYAILGVALAEELVFRGYIFHKLLAIKNSRWFAIIISSLLFGLFHIFNGNIIQIFMTAFIGFLYCIFREKIKGCTLLSLIIAHGVYDALIVLWVSIL